ncbi:hypothetical protein BGW80DRAFT_1446504 [Lactifluus volemus]|nr:hypothetical protein BGW80DRAFT_1446504 [Lactifluus volemus]
MVKRRLFNSWLHGSRRASSSSQLPSGSSLGTPRLSKCNLTLTIVFRGGKREEGTRMRFYIDETRPENGWQLRRSSSGERWIKRSRARATKNQKRKGVPVPTWEKNSKWEKLLPDENKYGPAWGEAPN